MSTPNDGGPAFPFDNPIPNVTICCDLFYMLNRINPQAGKSTSLPNALQIWSNEGERG
jgi:hypothetical protein